jgi:hypothetical protein
MRLIVTNNPKVRSVVQQSGIPGHQCHWVEGFTEDVLRQVRDLCHRSHQLITHPLTGSIKPNHTPYKTIVVEHRKNAMLHTASIEMAESSLRKAEDLLRSTPRPATYREHLTDFAIIDLDFFDSYLEAMGIRRGKQA